MATSMMKQRLIGAAVLIALGVIFIPMLLTGDGKFLSGESDSNVPPKPMYELEAPKVLPLDKRSGQASEPVAEAAPRSDKMAGNMPATDVAKTAEEAKTTPVNKEQLTVESAPKSEDSQKKTTTEQAKSTEPEAKEVIAPKQPIAKETTTKEATTEKSVSDAKSKPKSAEKTATESPGKTESSTNTGSSTNTKTSTQKPIVTGWVVQLGSFSVQKNALKLRDSLRKNGHASFVEDYTHNGKTSYRVRVGPEQTRELANELKKKLKAETKLDGFVIEFPGK